MHIDELVGKQGLVVIVEFASGELMSIDNQIDVATGTLKLKAKFDNDDESLFPNQFVNVHLLVSTDDKATVVPTIAVQQGSIGPFVYVIQPDNKAHIQPIKTGIVDGGSIAVTSGLTIGQQVVTEGLDRLNEGAQVEIMTGAAVPGTPAKGAVAPKAPAGSRTRTGH
jgi:multidrug efflux system membrane fusion protein